MNFRSKICTAFSLPLLLALATPVRAAGTSLQEILVTNQGAGARIEIEFACDNRYVDFSPITRTERVEVNVIATDRCVLAPSATPRRDVRRPPARELALLKELEFMQGGDGRGLLLMHFDRAVSVSVQQTGSLRRLIVNVELPAAGAMPPESVNESALLSAAGSVAGGGLSIEKIDELMSEGRDAMLAGDNARAAQIYTRVLLEPEHVQSRQAQEYLGLARERNGQAAHAVAEYRRYLMLYPDGEDAARVRQRLAGLVAFDRAPEAGAVAGAASVGSRDSRQAPSPWDVYGGLAQYYRRDTNQFDGRSSVVNQSSVLTDLDLIARRRGDRFDFSGRATLGNLYDLLAEDEGPGNSTRIYFMYTDLVDSRWDLSARLGRQSLRSSGVLGRFDGAELSWQWRPETRLNFVAGFPVDSADDHFDTDTRFYGVSADLTDLFGVFDANLFYNTQEISGIEDRQAVGAELRYYDNSRSLITLFDYDVSYGEINAAVLLGNWAFQNRLTLNVMLDFRKSPYLTTRNALIGQPVGTLEELLMLFGEGQIRQLAEDRTGEMQTYSFGISSPLFDRFQINADVTMLNFDGTIASAGVPAVPDVSGDTYYTVTVVGSSLMMEGDATIFGVGYVDGSTASTTSFTVDSRFPLSPGLRLNPRLRLSLRDNLRTDSEQWIAAPSLRFLYRFARRYELEIETGGEWSSQKLNTGTVDYNAYFIYAGYRADF